MARGDSTGVGRRESGDPEDIYASKEESEDNKSDSKLISLTLDCQQGCIEDYRHERFEWIVEVLPTYKTMPTILKREAEGRKIIYDLTYRGPGNKFTKEFPDAISEYDFTGFCYYEDNPEKKGNFNAKIIS
jgi:hypothetical protein